MANVSSERRIVAAGAILLTLALVAGLGKRFLANPKPEPIVRTAPAPKVEVDPEDNSLSQPPSASTTPPSASTEDKTTSAWSDPNPTKTSVPVANVTVPSVIHSSEADARQMLHDASLEMGVSKEPDDSVQPGYVISQSLAAGNTCAPGTIINVVLSTGPKPAETTPSPGDEEAIRAMVTAWALDWQNYQFDSFIQNYSTSARIKTLTRTYDYAAFAADQRRKFAMRGDLRIDVSEIQVSVKGDRAEATFRDGFNRLGGRGGTYHSVSRETWRLVRSSGTWKIVEDICRPYAN